MEKLEAQNGQKKEIGVYNEQKFYAIAQKVAGDLSISQSEMPLIKQKAMAFYLAFKQTPNADKCTQVSIEAAFREALESRLDLTKAKTQAYLIAYGNTLQFQSSYRGKARIAMEENQDIVPSSLRAVCVYKGDLYQDKILPNGRIVLVKHERPQLDKRSDEIIGCYAACTHKDRSTEIMFMSMPQIRKSWAKSRTGASVAKDFPEQMCQRTLLARFSMYLAGATSDMPVDYDEGRTYIDNDNNKEYDIPTDDENIIEVADEEFTPEEKEEVMSELHKEQNEEEPKVEVAETLNENSKNEDGTYQLSYKDYLKVKDLVEKVSYDESTKIATVRDKVIE